MSIAFLGTHSTIPPIQDLSNYMLSLTTNSDNTAVGTMILIGGLYILKRRVVK